MHFTDQTRNLMRKFGTAVRMPATLVEPFSLFAAMALRMASSIFSLTSKMLSCPVKRILIVRSGASSFSACLTVKEA